MRPYLLAVYLAAVLTIGIGMAQADAVSLRPQLRPDVMPDVTPDVMPDVMGLGAIRPMARPDWTPTPAAQKTPDIRPKQRPDLTIAPKLTAVAAQKTTPSMKGAVCQHPEIKGKALAQIVTRNPGCNVADPVLVSEIAGVALSPPATIDCEEAGALSTWITTDLQPIYNNAIVRLEVVDSYACRPRNNVPGNPVSVHGQGQAIDIASFVTNSGRTLTVARNYDAQMRKAEKAGCGTFHTILGPGSDGYHESHIHFDVAHHRGGAYCH